MAKKTKSTDAYSFGTDDDFGNYASEEAVLQEIEDVGYDEDQEIYIYKLIKKVKLKKTYVEVK